MCDNPGVEELQKQLAVARNELKNLRQKLLNLTIEHRNDVQTIKTMLVGQAPPSSPTDSGKTLFEPIGVIKSVFSEKRAVPRQANLVDGLQGCVEILSSCFNNPAHALEGLAEFSHLWIIFHFNRNNSTHCKAKVAPPRLNGDRVGVFSTRSPHRPCPLGLSLVRIERIEGNRVYFYGLDMVDGTPVFDLKPYIPSYDCPPDYLYERGASLDTSATLETNTREAPDGEENGETAAVSAVAASTSTDAQDQQQRRATGGTVRVPNWITATGPTLKVLFSEEALSRIEESGINRRTIVELLQTDPRSVYLRTKHGSQVQIFTFQLNQTAVTCKFDDSNGVVTVVQVRN